MTDDRSKFEGILERFIERREKGADIDYDEAFNGSAAALRLAKSDKDVLFMTLVALWGSQRDDSDLLGIVKLLLDGHDMAAIEMIAHRAVQGKGSTSDSEEDLLGNIGDDTQSTDGNTSDASANNSDNEGRSRRRRRGEGRNRATHEAGSPRTGSSSDSADDTTTTNSRDYSNR